MGRLLGGGHPLIVSEVSRLSRTNGRSGANGSKHTRSSGCPHPAEGGCFRSLEKIVGDSTSSVSWLSLNVILRVAT